MDNIFAQQSSGNIAVEAKNKQLNSASVNYSVPDYTISGKRLFFRIQSFLVGAVIGFAIMFIYYKLVIVSVIGGLAVGVANIFVAEKRAVKKRKTALRQQFYEMLEAMSVSMRAGNPVIKALESAREDLLLTYTEESDIIIELNIIIGKFNNAIPLAVAFADFAGRSGLEDIASFASVYATIEGKSSRADEIVKETQQIISDKMAIEMEIETLMTSAKSEANIMLFMPLLVLAIIGYAGAGFMDAIYTSAIGRIVATGGLIIFIISYILTQVFSNIDL